MTLTFTENYHKVQAISSTLLKEVSRRSPVHARYKAETFTPTPAMNLGTAVHCAILEPKEYENRFAIAPKVDKRTKAGKAEWAEFVESAGDKMVLTQEQANAVIAMTDNYLRHPACEGIAFDISKHPVQNGLIEAERYWEYETFSRLSGEIKADCKAKIDYVHKEQKILIDIKTTMDASTEAFTKQSWNLKYHLQLAFYLQAMGVLKNECGQWNVQIIAIENTAPHAVNVFKVGERLLQLGYDEWKDALVEYVNFYADMDEGIQVEPYGNVLKELGAPSWVK